MTPDPMPMAPGKTPQDDRRSEGFDWRRIRLTENPHSV